MILPSANGFNLDWSIILSFNKGLNLWRVDQNEPVMESEVINLALTDLKVPIVPNYKGVCLQNTSKPHSYHLIFMCLQFKSFENTEGKGEIARNEQFLLFPTLFYSILENFLPFPSRLKLLSANSFSLEESKVCLLEKGWNTRHCLMQLPDLTVTDYFERILSNRIKLIFYCIIWLQVYSSSDVRTALTNDANRFAVVNRDFRLLMRATEKNPNVLQCCSRKSMLNWKKRKQLFWENIDMTYAQVKGV